jgi:DNA mismatch repair protein MutS2
MDEARRRLSARDWQPIPLRRDLAGNNGGESAGESDGVTWQERLDSGDRVFIRGIPRPVEVITPPDDADRVEVLLGTMRAKIPVYQLERPAESGLLDGEPTRTSNPSGFRAVPGGGVFYRRPAANRPANTEINLHGYRVEPALDLVEDFLNDAALDGAKQVRILHGKGTGALRRAIREHFTDHPLVAWLGPEEGPAGEGVTVVSLQ